MHIDRQQRRPPQKQQYAEEHWIRGENTGESIDISLHWFTITISRGHWAHAVPETKTSLMRYDCAPPPMALIPRRHITLIEHSRHATMAPQRHLPQNSGTYYLRRVACHATMRGVTPRAKLAQKSLSPHYAPATHARRWQHTKHTSPICRQQWHVLFLAITYAYSIAQRHAEVRERQRGGKRRLGNPCEFEFRSDHDRIDPSRFTDWRNPQPVINAKESTGLYTNSQAYWWYD